MTSEGERVREGERAEGCERSRAERATEATRMWESERARGLEIVSRWPREGCSCRRVMAHPSPVQAAALPDASGQVALDLVNQSFFSDADAMEKVRGIARMLLRRTGIALNAYFNNQSSGILQRPHPHGL